ncbi:MAG: CBS domain-containing protein [Desulfosalsimonadaceae bacterium]|nr:CBS domain-containing protein [Desulfosalsimonadaceae bacterium]
MSDHGQCGMFGLSSIDLSEDDVMAAMKSIDGYIDITPKDFNEIYNVAFRHAVDRLSRLVKAEDIMTKQVIFVSPGTLLTETARMMATANISGVPVINTDQTVVGIISEKDFLKKMGEGTGTSGSFMGVIAQCLENRGCIAMPIKGKTAQEIMTSPVISAYPDTTISELSKKLADNRINRIPVITKQGKLVGIVSRGDIVDSYCAKVF